MTDQSLIALLAETRGLILSTAPNNKKREDILDRLAAALAREQAAQPAAQEPSTIVLRERTEGEKAAYLQGVELGKKMQRAEPQGAAQPAQEPDELLREWIDAIGVNPELTRWHVSREDVLQLIRTARSKP